MLHSLSLNTLSIERVTLVSIILCAMPSALHNPPSYCLTLMNVHTSLSFFHNNGARRLLLNEIKS